MFDHLPLQRRSEFIAKQILQRLRDGTLSLGDKLPTEREIAQQTGVSRPCVREALVALQLLGLVESRPGDGTYVVRQVPDPLTDTPMELLGTIFHLGFTPFQILEARECIETGAALLAMKRAGTDELQALETCLAAMYDCLERQAYEEYLDADWQFHTELVRAGENGVLNTTNDVLLKQMREGVGFAEARKEHMRRDPERWKQSIDIHRAIVETIQQRDPDALRAAMHSHFDQSIWMDFTRLDPTKGSEPTPR